MKYHKYATFCGTNITIDSMKDLKKYLSVDEIDNTIYYAIENFNITENFIEQCLFPVWSEFIDFRYIIPNEQILSSDFFEKYIEKFDFYSVYTSQPLTIEFIMKHVNKINYNILFCNEYINWKEFIRLGIDVILKLNNYEEKRGLY